MYLTKYRVTAMVMGPKDVRPFEAKKTIKAHSHAYADWEAYWEWNREGLTVQETVSVKEVQKLDFFALGAAVLSIAFVAVAVAV